jgi:hypothetical protein
MDECPHNLLVRGLCVACGADLSAEHHDEGGSPTGDRGRARLGTSGIEHLVPGARMRNKAKFADDDASRMEVARKLYLILDLDETLIHSVRGQPPAHARLCAPATGAAAASAAAPAAADGEGGDAGGATSAVAAAADGTVEMFVTAEGQPVLLRPHLRAFLVRMSALFHISLYTMGAQDYARSILSALDPSRHFFRGGLCAWDDGQTRTRKDLGRLAVRREMTLVVDDTSEVWAQDWRSLLLVPRWVGEPTDDSLVRIGDHLAAVHAAAFAPGARTALDAMPDVRDVLAASRPRIFAGCVFAFSGVFPRGVALGEQVVCRLVAELGGAVEDELSERTTHLIFRRPRTEKIQRAVAMARAARGAPAILWESWLLACIALWRKLPEGHMALSATDAAATDEPTRPPADVAAGGKRPREGGGTAR